MAAAVPSPGSASPVGGIIPRGHALPGARLLGAAGAARVLGGAWQGGGEGVGFSVLASSVAGRRCDSAVSCLLYFSGFSPPPRPPSALLLPPGLAAGSTDIRPLR